MFLNLHSVTNLYNYDRNRFQSRARRKLSGLEGGFYGVKWGYFIPVVFDFFSESGPITCREINISTIIPTAF